MPGISTGNAVIAAFCMGAVIFLCRLVPFLLFRGDDSGGEDSRGGEKRRRFFSLVEKTVPPVAMTVLAFNAIAAPLRETPFQALPVLAGAAFSAALHLWKRSALLSIPGGTALYMLLERLLHS
ncbi:MAG: AzlD domain-containing protein [Treponema sp.]|nr:AzlD domain-containing protein [Treponema sp.]